MTFDASSIRFSELPGCGRLRIAHHPAGGDGEGQPDPHRISFPRYRAPIGSMGKGEVEIVLLPVEKL
jgi:hypothetical protein